MAGAMLVSSLSYPLLQMARERKWCKFVGSSPHEYKSVLRGGLPSARSSYASLADAEGASNGPGALSPGGTDEMERAPLVGSEVLDMGTPTAAKAAEAVNDAEVAEAAAEGIPPANGHR